MFMDRREFISASLFSVSAFVPGCVSQRDSTNSANEVSTRGNDSAGNPPVGDGNPSSEGIEIAVYLFVDDVITEYMIGTTTRQTLNSCETAIQYALDSIGGETSVQSEINILTDPISISDDIDSNPLNASFTQKEILEYVNKASAGVDSHSNVLLTGVNIKDVSGTALDNNAAVDGPTPHFGVPEGDVCTNRSVSSNKRFLTYIVHEFGHTIGLSHNMGRVVDMGSNNAYVTPMLSRYVRSDALVGKENAFGELIPDIGNRSVVEVPYFNPDITAEDINLN